jgi:hypothetical protein
MSLERTAGGRVPHKRMVKVGVSVTGFPTASVAVFVGPIVAVMAVNAMSGVDVVVGEGVSVTASVGEASTVALGVSVATAITSVTVGCDVPVRAAAVCWRAASVPAASSVALGIGVAAFGSGIAGSTHAPATITTVNKRRLVFFIRLSL